MGWENVRDERFKFHK